MISLRILFIAVILIFQQSLFAQIGNSQYSTAENSGQIPDASHTFIASGISSPAKYSLGFSNHFSDTTKVKSFDTNTIQDPNPQHRWLRAAIVPASLIIAGTITLLPAKSSFLSKYSIHDKVAEVFPNFHSSVDDYLQYAPYALVFGLKAAGVKSRSDFVNQAVITAKAELLMSVIVTGMKKLIPSERPSGSGENSMPSGHTATAFVAATILDMEYRDTSPWISVAGYAMATTTGVYRMANNQHWISDVLIGAGIGIFSAKLVYFTHQYHWGKKNTNMVILPAIYKNGGGISFAMQM